jgi:hypothetical protein
VLGQSPVSIAVLASAWLTVNSANDLRRGSAFAPGNANRYEAREFLGQLEVGARQPVKET